MKKFLYVVVICLCISGVVFGQFYYSTKLEKNAEAARQELKMGPVEVTKASAGNKKTKSNSSEEAFAKLPEEAQKLIKEKVKNNEKIHITIIGSELVEEKDSNWTTLFKNELQSLHPDLFEVSSIAFEENSLDVVKTSSYEEVVSAKADLILLEPFLLNDNGDVSIEDTLYNVDKIILDFKETNERSVAMVLPANPIYQPNVYATQIKELKEHAADKDITYLDFWQSWPSTDSKDINEYLDKETLQPNQKGHQLMADWFVDLFK